LKRFVLDCSVTMAWCFEDEASSISDKVLNYLSKTDAVVPVHWPLEVSNVLLVAERRKRLTKAETVRFLSIISSLPITIDSENPNIAQNATITLARDSQLSSYDAAYLELAMREGVALATLDRNLKRAAIKMGVALVK